MFTLRICFCWSRPSVPLYGRKRAKVQTGAWALKHCCFAEEIEERRQWLQEEGFPAIRTAQMQKVLALQRLLERDSLGRVIFPEMLFALLLQRKPWLQTFANGRFRLHGKMPFAILLRSKPWLKTFAIIIPICIAPA